MTQMSTEKSRADDTDWAWASGGSIWLALLIRFRQQPVVTNSEMLKSAQVEKQHPIECAYLSLMCKSDVI